MIMDWKTCEKEFVKIVEVDVPRIQSLLSSSKLRLSRARSPFQDNFSFALEDYYEAIKEVLVAFMLSYGYKSSNHQCLISFFYKETQLEKESLLIQQMSFYRNRLAYYGEAVPSDFVKDNEHVFEELYVSISLLIQNRGAV